MRFEKILIANRGEIALRIAHAVADLGRKSVAIYPKDDRDALHVSAADHAILLPGQGAEAYLSSTNVIAAALSQGCDAIHPGYGFLSESPQFAADVAAAGLAFIGPNAEMMGQLGDKSAALDLAEQLDVPIAGRVSLADPLTAPVIVKAVAGGGGRGMRIIPPGADQEAEVAVAKAEALAAFGNGAIFAERYIPNARHIEVQIIADGSDAAHLWERDCSAQRLHQKVLEIAPAQNLPHATRDQLLTASLRMARAVGYRGLCTFEFLLGSDGQIAFIEANTRLQVEHTITEAITGIDLVCAQIEIAQGASLTDLGLTQAQIPEPKGTALQLRIATEQLNTDGTLTPTSGRITTYAPPGGPGLRVDGAGFSGMASNPAYDSLLAKLIISAPSLATAISRAKRALASFHIEGIATNKPLLAALLDTPELAQGTLTTNHISNNLAALASPPSQQATNAALLTAPMQGTLVSLHAKVGDTLAAGDTLATLSAMKMQHALRLSTAARILSLTVEPGDTLAQGDIIAHLDPIAGETSAKDAQTIDLDHIRPDLKDLQARQALTSDEARPEAVKKRHAKGKRMARENIADLCDDGSFAEYGDLVIAAQRSRRSLEDLQKNTPADGLIAGFGTINGAEFGESARCAVMAYDYTVLAGTQGLMNHAKTDRILDLAYRQRTPLVFFCEGGGGRPGDVDAAATSIAGLHVTTFWQQAKLSGRVPMVGIGSGRLFAGNAALLGCCDVVIATRDANIGMGGPAMIEGGGLGSYAPEEVGPSDVQAPNGVIDILVKDEVEAVAVAKQYLSYFQGPLADWSAADPRALRHVVPENRLEVYDVHTAIDALADEGSVLELRADFAPGMVTSLMRIEGRPMGVMANNPIHLAGAIDSPGADKAARFVQLCDAHDLPILSLCDTPGMMVGPDVEKTALVRHCSRLFLAAGNAEVPLMTLVLRKGYGLGAMAMAGGSFRTPLFVASWPTGEFGGMGLEGAVRLGYRKELEAVADPVEREALFEKMVAESYARGKATSAASVFEIDTVIDPAESRAWVVNALKAAGETPKQEGKKRAYIDSW